MNTKIQQWLSLGRGQGKTNSVALQARSWVGPRDMLPANPILYKQRGVFEEDMISAQIELISAKYASQNNPVVERPKLSPAETKALIEEIHNSFYTEVDRLLADSKVKLSLKSEKQALLDKVERLKKLGFTATKEAQEAEPEIERIIRNLIKNNVNDAIAKAIQYFQQKYPQYKFITEDSVKLLCDKYNLVYGSIDKYIGSVPDKNIEQMENFKIHPEDEAWRKGPLWGSGAGGYISAPEPEEQSSRTRLLVYDAANVTFKATLEICAPLSDFDQKKMELKGRQLVDKIEVPDPVVLQPVMYNGVKHYLIVTAWGDEATDEAVVNEKMN